MIFTGFILILTSFLLMVLCSIFAAYSDFKSMTISNTLSMSIVATFAVAFLTSLALPNALAIFPSLFSPFIAAFSVFIATFIMFSRGMIGGGDAKFASALALWFGTSNLIPFLFFMSLAGGILAVSALLLRGKPFLEPFAKKLGTASWFSKLYTGESALPYGIAITIGAWIALWKSDIFAQIIALSTQI